MQQETCGHTVEGDRETLRSASPAAMGRSERNAPMLSAEGGASDKAWVGKL